LPVARSSIAILARVEAAVAADPARRSADATIRSTGEMPTTLTRGIARALAAEVVEVALFPPLLDPVATDEAAARVERDAVVLAPEHAALRVPLAGAGLAADVGAVAALGPLAPAIPAELAAREVERAVRLAGQQAAVGVEVLAAVRAEVRAVALLDALAEPVAAARKPTVATAVAEDEVAVIALLVRLPDPVAAELGPTCVVAAVAVSRVAVVALLARLEDTIAAARRSSPRCSRRHRSGCRHHRSRRCRRRARRRRTGSVWPRSRPGCLPSERRSAREGRYRRRRSVPPDAPCRGSRRSSATSPPRASAAPCHAASPAPGRRALRASARTVR